MQYQFGQKVTKIRLDGETFVQKNFTNLKMLRIEKCYEFFVQT